MTLPVRLSQRVPHPRDSAARLIVFTRHEFPQSMLAVAAADIRRRGRPYTFSVLAAMATPIVLYHQTVGDRPPAALGFTPGSAERFAHGYVGALLDGLGGLRHEYAREFQGSCENEVERAMALMTARASQCLNLLEEIAAYDGAISTL